MASTFAIVWLLLFCLASGSFAQIDCPPLNEDGAFIVHSQDDADKLKGCPTFKGDLKIFPKINQSLPIILDGPIDIVGELHVVPPFYLKSLVTVAFAMYIENYYGVDPPASSVGTLEFPALKSVRWFSTMSMSHVSTISFPSLETAGTLLFGGLSSLHNISVPKLKDIKRLELWNLPSLKTFSFRAGLQTMSDLSIWNNSELESIGGLTSRKVSVLEIFQNRKLCSLSFPYLTAITPNILGLAGIRIANNSDSFFLDLPQLKGVRGHIVLSGVAAINVPELSYIDSGVVIGALDYPTYTTDRCTNCLPNTGLTTFSAPKLTRVSGTISFDSCPALTNISLPALHSTSGISVNNTAAVNSPNGTISLPSLKRVCNVQITGDSNTTTAPNCTPFDDLDNRGVILESYFCGANHTDSMPTASPTCAARMKSWSQVLLVQCYGNLFDGCVSGDTLSRESTVRIAVLTVVAGTMGWYVWRRCCAAVRLVKAKRSVAVVRVKAERADTG